jgi:uncharacterized protein (UPF0548 family)
MTPEPGDEKAPLAVRRLTYSEVGATRPEDATWAGAPADRRPFERSARLGRGEALWGWACTELLSWGVKTRSGFDVLPQPGGSVRVTEGADFWLRARLGPARIHEPVRVVGVVDRAERVGFAYGTLAGHPVSGEEAFIVHRDDDELVWITLRSITAPAPGAWRLAFPIILLAQRVYRRRYLGALGAQTRTSE